MTSAINIKKCVHKWTTGTEKFHYSAGGSRVEVTTPGFFNLFFEGSRADAHASRRARNRDER